MANNFLKAPKRPEQIVDILKNRQFTLGPKDVCNKVKNLRSPKRYAAQAVVIDRLMAVVNPEFRWRDQLFNLMQKYRAIDVNILGFSDRWQDSTSWMSYKSDKISNPTNKVQDDEIEVVI